MTSIDPIMMQKISQKFAERDKILEIVYMGDTQDVMAYNVERMKPNKMIAIGNISDFNWNIKVGLSLTDEILFDEKKTGQFILTATEYLEERSADSWIGVDQLSKNLAVFPSSQQN